MAQSEGHAPAHGTLAIPTRIAGSVAFAWCLLLLVGAATFPAYQGERGRVTVERADTGAPVVVDGSVSTSATLVEENGPWALVVVGIPLLPVAAVAATLWVRSRRRRSAGPLAWTLVGLVGTFAALGMLTIGVFVLPIFVALVAACATTDSAASRAKVDQALDAVASPVK